MIINTKKSGLLSASGMRITQEGDYALRAVLFMCKLGAGKKIEAQVLSKAENIPLRFLLKLLRKLTKTGIFNSFRGVHGGYTLLKQPEEISLKDVIESIEGPVILNRCLYNASACNVKRGTTCEVHYALAIIQQKLLDNLQEINFKDIMNKSI